MHRVFAMSDSKKKDRSSLGPAHGRSAAAETPAHRSNLAWGGCRFHLDPSSAISPVPPLDGMGEPCRAYGPAPSGLAGIRPRLPPRLTVAGDRSQKSRLESNQLGS